MWIAPLCFGLRKWMTRDARLYPTRIPNEKMRHVGTFSSDGESRLTLQARIKDIMKRDFQIGQVIVAPAACERLESMVLAGSPGLFQRLLAREIIASKLDLMRL